MILSDPTVFLVSILSSTHTHIANLCLLLSFSLKRFLPTSQIMTMNSYFTEKTNAIARGYPHISVTH